MFGLRYLSVRASAIYLGAMALAFASITSGAEAQDPGRPRLGLSLRDLSPDTAYEYGVPIPGGLEVGRVSRGSPADAAGIMPGDIIIMVDGRKVLDTPALMEAMDRVLRGKSMRVSVLRRGELLHMPVDLWKPAPAEPARETRQTEAPRPAPDREAETPRQDEEPRRTAGREAGTPPAPQRQAGTPPVPEADAPWLGVSTADLTPEEAARLRLGKSGGAKVVSVAKGSPLGEMGVKPGDVIVKLDKQPVTDSRALDATLAGKRPGTRVMLSYVRDGDPRYLAIKLGQRPEAGGGQKEADAEHTPAAPSGGPADAERSQETGGRSGVAGSTIFGAPADSRASREAEDRPESAGNTIFGAPADAEPGPDR